MPSPRQRSSRISARTTTRPAISRTGTFLPRIISSRGPTRAHTTAPSPVVQPMIEPLYGGKSAHDVFQTLLDNPLLSAYEAVRITQKDNIKGDFETGWRKALHAGWIDDTTYGRAAEHQRLKSSQSPGAKLQRSVRNHLPSRSEHL